MDGWTNVAQIMIVSGSFILILIAMILFRKRSGKVSFPWGSLTLGEKAKTDPRVTLCQARIDEQLITIRQIFYSDYLRLLKINGCPDEILGENDDSEFVNQCLGNIVFSGNGIKSIKSIIEKSLLDESIFTMEFTDYVKYLLDASQLNAVKYMNDHYHTFVRLPDGSQRERLVSCVEWFNSIPETMNRIKIVLESVVRYSRKLYEVTK
jgi:hypothetical protein